MRRACLFFLLFFGVSAFAAPAAEVSAFNWQHNGRFEIAVVIDGQQAVLQGHMAEGGEAKASSGNVNADLKSYKEGFIAVAVSLEQDDQAQLIILERAHDSYLPLTQTSIRAYKDSAIQDLQAGVDGLNKYDGWGPAISIRALVAYFKSNPNKTLKDFLNEAEQGDINILPKPTPKTDLSQNRPIPPPQPVPRPEPQRPYYPEYPPQQPPPPPQWQQPPPYYGGGGGGYQYVPW